MRKPVNIQLKSFNPWMVLLIVAPIPLIILVFFAFQWNRHQTDLSSAASFLLKRQNKVLAHDAMTLSRRISDLLESGVRDVGVVAIFERRKEKFIQFASAVKRPVVRLDPKTFAVRTQELPLYNEIVAGDLRGNEIIKIVNGKSVQTSAVGACLLKNLCDADLWKHLLNAKAGTYRIGKLMRYYSSRSEEEDLSGSTLRVGYRSHDAIYMVGIDYAHFRDVLYQPTFPYEPKTNPLESYEAGNYVYYVDDSFDFLTHPKYWHVIGVSKKTGDWQPPAKTDADVGQYPLNIKAYQGHELKDYFTRLLEVSFSNNNIDLFRAPNLTGKIRVLSVAPILFNKGQFAESGVFGHVVTGCRVDYFEEPSEKYLPYY